MEASNFEQFKSRQVVRYQLVTTVNDEVVARGEYADIETLISEGTRKAERAVEHQIGMDFDDNENMKMENEVD